MFESVHMGGAEKSVCKVECPSVMSKDVITCGGLRPWNPALPNSQEPRT